jgi:hypothetical protein
MIFIVMKVKFKKPSNLLTPEQFEVIGNFIQFLQGELALTDDVNIGFLDKKMERMTTGVRMPQNQIYVLAGGRMLIDIIRTVAHEWIHEYQHQKMGLKDGDQTQDIGGKEENMANALGGVMVKKFEKINPELKNILYGES